MNEPHSTVGDSLKQQLEEFTKAEEKRWEELERFSQAVTVGVPFGLPAVVQEALYSAPVRTKQPAFVVVLPVVTITTGE